MSSVILTSFLKYDRGQGLEIDRDLCIQQWEETYKPGKMCWNLIKKCVETPKTSHDGGPLVVNRELCAALQWEDMFKPGKYTKWKMCKKVHGRCVKKSLANSVNAMGQGEEEGKRQDQEKWQEKEKTLNVGVKIRTQREKKKTERTAENFMPYFHIL